MEIIVQKYENTEQLLEKAENYNQLNQNEALYIRGLRNTVFKFY